MHPQAALAADTGGSPFSGGGNAMPGHVRANPLNQRKSLTRTSDRRITHSGEPAKGICGEPRCYRPLLVVGAMPRMEMDKLHLAVRVGLLEDLLEMTARGVLGNVQLQGGVRE